MLVRDNLPSTLFSFGIRLIITIIVSPRRSFTLLRSSNARGSDPEEEICFEVVYMVEKSMES